MINIQELIIHLQKKITQYRYQQKRVRKGKTELAKTHRILTQLYGDSRQYIKNNLQNLKESIQGKIFEISRFYEKKIADQKQMYEREIYEMQAEIERQYRVMAAMKKEVEDLEELIIMQNSKKQHFTQFSGEREHQQQQNKRDNILICSPEQSGNHSVNGLEVIEEEDTDRTIMSSGHSAHKNQFSSAKGVPQFKQEHQEDQKYENIQRNQINQFKFSMDNSRASQSFQHSSDESGFFSGCGGYGIAEDEKMSLADFCRRQKTCTIDEQQSSDQYQSLPLSLDDYFLKQSKKQLPLRQQFNTWQGPAIAASLKDITNSEREKQTSQERQSKAKMFLQEFKRTFDKCLSTASVCRKQSSKSDVKKKLSTDQKSSHFAKNKELNKADSQKLITEMLRDIDNNNKFCVGNRRNQVRYDGEKKQGFRNGRGILYYSNGLWYEGEFKNNMRHGFGALKFNQSLIYSGEWQADELSGRGKLKNFALINKKKSQGSHSALSKWVSYIGSFRNNRFEGEGTLLLQSNEKFLGKFICGMACGAGTLYRKNGEVQTGIWRNNEIAQQC